MTNSRTRRNICLLASTSVMASVMTALPVSIELQGQEAARPATQPPPMSGHLGRPAAASSNLSEVTNDALDPVEAAQRDALARLGLGQSGSYATPVILTLSRAWAASGPGSSGKGGGNSGSGSGGSGGGNSGSGGGSGSSSGSSGGSDAGSSSSGKSQTPWHKGVSGASFGDIEQDGPDLSEDEEAAAIENGWQ